MEIPPRPLLPPLQLGRALQPGEHNCKFFLHLPSYQLGVQHYLLPQAEAEGQAEGEGEGEEGLGGAAATGAVESASVQVVVGEELEAEEEVQAAASEAEAEVDAKAEAEAEGKAKESPLVLSARVAAAEARILPCEDNFQEVLPPLFLILHAIPVLLRVNPPPCCILATLHVNTPPCCVLATGHSPCYTGPGFHHSAE